MPPKKKGNKKNDDWDEGLGETADPIAAATEAAKEEEAAQDGEEEGGGGGGGGLLAALKKNRGKRGKKGKVVEDFVEGEDPAQADDLDGANGAPAEEELAAKAPEEATMDDEDVFAQPAKKGKGGKGGKPAAKADEPADADEDADDGGGLKSKKEKEKEKKEREKQRKKEQVRLVTVPATDDGRVCYGSATICCTGEGVIGKQLQEAAASGVQGKRGASDSCSISTVVRQVMQAESGPYSCRNRQICSRM